MIHLKNPYVVSLNPADSHRPWLRKDAANITQVHPGHQAHFYYKECGPTTPFVGLVCPDDPVTGFQTTHDYYTDGVPTHTRQFYNDDYAFKARNWPQDMSGAIGAKRYGYEFWASFNQIEMADLDGDGYYDLYGAPRSPTNYGLNHKAVIYRYEHPKNASNDYNTDYQDGVYPDNKYKLNEVWEDGVNSVIVTQCMNFHLVDMDKDGIVDILCGQGYGGDPSVQSGVPISWIKGKNNGTFENRKSEDYRLAAAGTVFDDLWAGNLRGKPGEWPADNPKGSPDLVILRRGEPKIDVSLYVDTTKAGVSPRAATYSNWKTVYTVPNGDFAPGMGDFFKRVITADVDGDGYEDLIAATGSNIYADKGGRAAFWIFKKDTTLYLTQRIE
jgi:hypothetical protein